MDDQAPIFNVTPENFQTEVIERSQQVPVMLLFWADQVPESAQARAQLEPLVSQYQGKVLLGLVDVAVDQTLAQHLRVQGLPSIRVISGGQLADQIDGPQPESALRELLDGLTMSSGELLRDQLQVYIDTGEYASALAVLQQAIEEEPQNQVFRVELADVLAMQNELDEARSALATIPADTADVERPKTRIELAEEAAGMGSMDELTDLHQRAPDDLEIRYQLAVVGAAEKQYESALEHCLAILQADREFREDIGRTTMIRIFTLLEKGSEVATRYRRRMFAFMH
jgi:putative thioredoxin